MSKFKAFKKIPQFKDAIKSLKLKTQFVGLDEDGQPIYDKDAPLPKLKFIGTTKLHGSNSGVRLNSDGSITPQKRSSDLGGNSGHFGFVEHVKAYEDFYKEQLSNVAKEVGSESVIVFGEWCGSGVQKKVAISELTKRFVAFEVWDATNEKYLDSKEALKNFRDHSKNIFNIWDYKIFEIEVDVKNPQLAVDQINKLVDEVEQICPVAKDMLLKEKPGRYEDRGEFLGEGIVFRSEDNEIWFKSKGERHSKGGGGKKASVDPIKAKTVKEFVEKVVSEDRLDQCWNEIKSNVVEVEKKHLGLLMKWIFNDIMEEEGDALVFNNLTKKDVSGAIANEVRPWFIKKIESFD